MPTKQKYVSFDPEVLKLLDEIKGRIHRGSRSLVINALLKGTLPRIKSEIQEKRLIKLDGCEVRL